MSDFFAPCPRALELLLARELTSLGARHILPVAGGVAFSGDWGVCYRANLESRIATRVLWRLAHAPYRHEDDLYRLARAQDWPLLFGLDRGFRVQTTAIRAPLKSLEFATLRVKDALCDRFREACGARPDVDTHEPDVRVHLFLSGREATLYLDTSGAPLWQRGLCHANVDAPLKENLAAGVLQLSGWQPGVPLLDPMCGGGTFALEAACMTLNRAPGLERPRFGFEALKPFQRETWQEIRRAALAKAQENTGFLSLWASDNDEKAVRATRRNLEAAGFASAVEVACRDALECTAPVPGGILIANPPYGERIGEAEQLAAFYPLWSQTLKRQFAGWKACVFTADTRFPKLLRLKPAKKTPLFNGALECRLYEIPLVSGSHRDVRGKQAQ
ncbi:MAG: THUMP domain-containing protein [Zoogloeaceae bacterium]|jgi:putative N6-adenine-specific DNA methylase|nr:THUMP domain-containing protein [Zoogloeaceae bacterium]